MKKPFHFLFNFIVLTSFAQTYSLTVNSGYGSGNFRAGETLHVWSTAIPANSVFNKWTGDISNLESNNEWHTTLVMPAQNTSISANFRTIGTININYEKIMGRDTLKNVYSYFPLNFKGVIWCFHGSGGQASNWTLLPEYKQFLNDAIADTFAFMITEAEEITKQTDFDNNGKLRWAANPMDTINNVDYANIKVLLDTFRLRGITNGTTKYYAVGMSNGGNFSPSIATTLGWEAAVSYCAQSYTTLMNTTTLPVQWCMAKYDNNENVGAQGNANALLNHNTLVNRGICSKYFSHDHSPVYAERFARTGNISLTISANLKAELKTNNLLDSLDYLRYSADTIQAKILAIPTSYPVYASLNGLQKIIVGTQIDAMYSAHQFYSDYNKRTLHFFDALCTNVTPNALENLPVNTFNVFPNPFCNSLTIQNLNREKAEVIAVFERKIYESEINLEQIKINTENWSSGMYLVKVGRNVKKIVKE